MKKWRLPAQNKEYIFRGLRITIKLGTFQRIPPPRKCNFPSPVAEFSDCRWRIGLRVIRGAQDTRRAGAPLHSRHPPLRRMDIPRVYGAPLDQHSCTVVYQHLPKSAKKAYMNGRIPNNQDPRQSQKERAISPFLS